MSLYSVIIVTHNNETDIERCLQSVVDAGIPLDQVVVVDNNSTDTTQNILHRWKSKTIFNSVNNGFATACNQGAAQSKNEYLLFLNPDAALQGPQSLQIIHDYLQAHPKTGVIGGMLVTDEGTLEEKSFGKDVTVWSLLSRKLSSQNIIKDDPSVVGWVSAGAMIIRRDVWEVVQGFDPAFFLYWEDVDLCKRVREKGYSVALFPAWKVIHKRGVSLSDKTSKARIYDKSADRYFQKHYANKVWIYRILRWFYRLWQPQAR